MVVFSDVCSRTVCEGCGWAEEGLSGGAVALGWRQYFGIDGLLRFREVLNATELLNLKS